MGDIGEFWRDVKDARRAAGLPARRSAKPLAERTTKTEMRTLRGAGFRQCSEWHWQIRVMGDLLDYWPSKAKWRWRDETVHGEMKKLLAFVVEHSA